MKHLSPELALSSRSDRPVTTAARSVAMVAALSLTTSDGQAQQLRFSTTAPGGIASTGNTLGLAKAPDANGPGTEHSIGTFIALDPSSVDPGPADGDSLWPLGTTADWRSNGSAAELALPAGAKVLHAELVWAGSYDYWPEDVSAHLDEPVAMVAGSQELLVHPDSDTALTLAQSSHTGFWANYYLRSADVTSFVAAYGSGRYRVAGVAATQGDLTNTLSGAGWSLVVAYREASQPIRNLSIFVGGSFVDENSEQDYVVSGFCAPPHGAVEGNVVISALEGDAELVGDQLGIGESPSGPFVALQGPNNPAQNFFCSQINGADGSLDRSGSFGDANHDAQAGVNAVGARQGWDLTTVALSSERGQLRNDQTSAVLRTATTGDSYLPTLVAIELDVKSPDFGDSRTETSSELVELGERFTVVTSLTNGGEAQAAELTLALAIDGGLELTRFTIDGRPGDADGAAVSAADLAGGVAAGALHVGQSRAIELEVRVVAPPDDGSRFVFAPKWGHFFTMCSGDAPLDESFSGPSATVDFFDDRGSPGEGGSGGGGAPSALHDSDDPEEMGGCQCAALGGTSHGAPGSKAGALALLALGFSLAWRRRR